MNEYQKDFEIIKDLIEDEYPPSFWKYNNLFLNIQDLVNKATPMKVFTYTATFNEIQYTRYLCPQDFKEKKVVFIEEWMKHCPRCSQKLDWSESK